MRFICRASLYVRNWFLIWFSLLIPNLNNMNWLYIQNMQYIPLLRNVNHSFQTMSIPVGLHDVKMDVSSLLQENSITPGRKLIPENWYQKTEQRMFSFRMYREHRVMLGKPVLPLLKVKNWKPHSYTAAVTCISSFALLRSMSHEVRQNLSCCLCIALYELIEFMNFHKQSGAFERISVPCSIAGFGNYKERSQKDRDKRTIIECQYVTGDFQWNEEKENLFLKGISMYSR